MSKPKAPDYKASEVEKMNAAIAMQDKQFYRENYLPKLKEFTEQSFRDEGALMNVAEGRAQADTYQTLTANPNRRAMMSVDAQADLTSAAAAQSLQGTRQGLTAARSDQVSAIKMANQMASTTASGLSQASRIATTDTLNRAAAKQTRTQGMINAATILGKQGAENVKQYRAAQTANLNYATKQGKSIDDPSIQNDLLKTRSTTLGAFFGGPFSG